MECIGDNLWRVEAKKSGPHLLVLGGVHGNELTGIQAVRWLRKRFGARGERLTSGTLTVGFGNPEAIRRNTRGSAPHQDLNRCFTKEKIAAPVTYEEKRAAVLARYMDGADILVDLHAVNTPSKPFVIATAEDANRLALGAAFPCDTFVVAPDEVIAGSTDGWIGQCGGYGIGYESGYMKDLARMGEVKDGLDRILHLLGLLSKQKTEARQRKIVRMTEAIVLKGERFVFANNRGKMSFEPFRKDDLIGMMDGKRIKAPHDGLLLFPKPKRLHKTGLPVGFLAIEK